MASLLNPYLSFKDNAREAFQFYQTVFGGQLTMSTFKEFQVSEDPADANKIMHAMLVGDRGITFMGADTPSYAQYDGGSRISMSLSGEDEAELHGYFEKLSVGGQINQPLEKAPWGDSFGMLTDRYGVDWMVNINAPKP